MANKATTGFWPVSKLDGSPISGGSLRYFGDSNLFLGDLVKRAADGQTRDDGIYNQVTRATAASELIEGVVVGWEANPTALDNLYYATSNVYSVYVLPLRDADVILEAQSDDSTMVSTDVGLNIDPVFTAGTTATGQSNMALDGDTAATTAGLLFHIIRGVARPDNDLTDSVANQRFLVTMNQSAWLGQNVGV